MSAMNDEVFYLKMKRAFDDYYDYYCPTILTLAGPINNLPEMFAAINALSSNPSGDASMITLMAIERQFEVNEEVML